MKIVTRRTCIVSDGIMSFTLAAAQELGVPQVQLWTAKNVDASYLTNGYLETTLDGIPGMKDVHLRDLPSFLSTTNPDDFMIKFVQLQETERARKASAIVINTFETLEMYPIGPLHLLVKHVDDENLKGLGWSLWKEEPMCLQWLDNKEPNSVVYVNFGSTTVMTPNQLIEFAWGLSNSQQKFLWIIGSNIVSSYESILPPEFVEETKNRGMLASWCSQEVLSHSAIGGFLTHGGWNSTLESITSGVPMLCRAAFREQMHKLLV
ncbi:hypothetical protein H5410_063082 [Solanum commersonii]|uniref:Uncharacterized protein n=1 Tax=Solanum commersonii TaxID=4109 RepID=A0A9J5WDE5_SOLCO|nr:hypothetical protein H5410_063082 [Solanum commersonii]